MQIGGSLCTTVMSNDTHIVCTTPPHTTGEFDVEVTVDRMGRADGVITFTYQLGLNYVSHCDGYVLNRLKVMYVEGKHGID